MSIVCTICNINKDESKFECKRRQCVSCRSKLQRKRNKQKNRQPIDIKKCSSCKISKNIKLFNKNCNFPDGFHAQCKECRRNERKVRENKNRIKNKTKIFGTDELSKCTVCKLTKLHSKFNKSATRANGLSSLCRSCLRTYRKSEEYKERERTRINSNIDLKIKLVLRGRVNKAIRNNQKSGSAVNDLGCSVSFFKSYIESMFYDNIETGEKMSWENYGYYGWHIDHILPLSSFDLSSREQMVQACNYKNLQPLWAKENLSKGARIC